MPPIILYQAYGKAENHYQTLVSITSLQQLDENGFGRYTVVVYTDNQEIFQQYLPPGVTLIFVQLTHETIAEWQGPHRFVHRLKVLMIADAFERFGRGILYLDGDTEWLALPEALFEAIGPGSSLMHIRETDFMNPQGALPKKIGRFLQRTTLDCNGNQLRIAPQTELWNAGVLGIAHENRHLVREVLALTDALYGQYQKHIMEQLAFSYVLGQHTTLRPADASIKHYWDIKHEILPLIVKGMEGIRNYAGTLLALAIVNKPPLMPKQPSFWQRLIGKGMPKE